MPTRPYIQQRATAQPQGFDQNLWNAAQAIAGRRPWIPGSQQQGQRPVQNPYTANQFAPSLTGLSPTGRFNDMRARRQALYASLAPNGQVVQNGTVAPLTAPQILSQQPDVDSGIGYGTDEEGNATAVTPLGGKVITTAPGDMPLTRTLLSKYGTGSAVDTGAPQPGGGRFAINMAGGTKQWLPMDQFRTPQAQALQDRENTIAADGGTPDPTGDFQEFLDKLKAANAPVNPLRKK